MPKVALDHEDLDTHHTDQEGQWEHGRIDKVVFPGSDNGAVSAFGWVVGDLCVGMDNDTFE